MIGALGLDLKLALKLFVLGDLCTEFAERKWRFALAGFLGIEHGHPSMIKSGVEPRRNGETLTFTPASLRER